jgi:Trypsin
MYETKPWGNSTRQFLLDSICFKKVRQVYVCCPDAPEVETISVFAPFSTANRLNLQDGPWLAKLKQKVQQPPMCGSDDQNKIVGGELAEITDFPWTVLIEYDKGHNETGIHCSGSLISELFVLTGKFIAFHRDDH